MFDARTIAYFNNSLAGPEELLHQFFDAAISVGEVYHENENYKWIEVMNNCDIPFMLIEGPDGVSSSFVLEANTITTVRVSKAKDPLLVFRVKNVLTAYDTYLEAELK